MNGLPIGSTAVDMLLFLSLIHTEAAVRAECLPYLYFPNNPRFSLPVSIRRCFAEDWSFELQMFDDPSWFQRKVFSN